MHKMECKPRWGASPSGKPRVYFTCHPDDFDTYFEKVCEDLFAAHDCAVYYTADMREPIPEEYIETDLGSNNLFVVPVTVKLLKEPNRAMNEDIRYAKEHHIPILPLLMEIGAAGYYEREENFGNMQYLCPNPYDDTAISYEEKLKKHLESVLASEELMARIRAEFDAYIFLSYRKKDRQHANALMKAIHSIESCRGVAIWFDEFLTPGDDFKANIDEALDKSSLFTLLVTPSLLEMPDGKKNYVMEHEYPDALKLKKSGKLDIMPVEMVETSRGELAEKYAEIADIVDFNDENRDTELEIKINCSSARADKKESSPEHTYLIGCAYLEGIDVEINRELGIKLITEAAEAGVVEAMERLYSMYLNGEYVLVNYEKAVLWSERMVNYCTDIYGEENTNTLKALHNLLIGYRSQGEYLKALDIFNRAYMISEKLFGLFNTNTLTILYNEAHLYGCLGKYSDALAKYIMLNDMRETMFGKDDVIILRESNNIVEMYLKLKKYQDAIDYCKNNNLYDRMVASFGEKHDITLTFLHNLSVIYLYLGNAKEALKIQSNVYTLRCDLLGENHPHTIRSLGVIANIHRYLSDFNKSLEIQEKVYNLSCEVLGFDHPETNSNLNNYAAYCVYVKKVGRALRKYKEAYLCSLSKLGSKHPSVLSILNGMASCYVCIENYEEALSIYLQVCSNRCEVLPKGHQDTIDTMINISICYMKMKRSNEALKSIKDAFLLVKENYGESDFKMIEILIVMEQIYRDMRYYKEVVEIQNRIKALKDNADDSSVPKN